MTKKPLRNVTIPNNEDDRPVVDLEAVHDEKIAPLMDQILDICKEHGIPMVASFEYAPGSFCTSCMTRPAADDRLKAAHQILRQGFAAFAVTGLGPRRKGQD